MPLPHMAVREKFSALLMEAVNAAYERWRHSNEKNYESAIMHFWEECGGSSYEFWKIVRRNSKDPHKTIVKTERSYRIFVSRVLENFGDPTKTNELTYYFDHVFWPAEKKWLKLRHEAKNSSSDFLELTGGLTAYEVLKRTNSFRAYSFEAIWYPYVKNAFSVSIRNARAICHELSECIPRLKGNEQIEAIKILIEASLSLAQIEQNCGFLEYDAGSLARQCLTRAREQLENKKQEQLQFQCSLYNSILERTAARLQSPFNGQIEFEDYVRAVVAFILQKCEVEGNSPAKAGRDGVFGSFLSAEIKRIHSELLQAKSIEFASDNREIRNQFNKNYFKQLIKEFASFSHESALENLSSACNTIFHNPNCVGLLEIIEINRTRVANPFIPLYSGSLCISYANYAVKSLALEYVPGNLITARNIVMHCPSHLIWSEFYSCCADYFKKRGNGAASQLALSLVRETQLAAGNQYAVKITEQNQRNLLQTQLPPTLGDYDSHEEELFDFLLEVPPTLSAKS